MSWDKNPYDNPESYGLVKVAEMELSEPCWSFDILAAWRDGKGDYYMGTDSGCSCPMPFENYDGKDDLTGPLTKDQVIAEAKSLAEGSFESQYALRQLPDFIDTIQRGADS